MFDLFVVVVMLDYCHSLVVVHDQMFPVFHHDLLVAQKIDEKKNIDIIYRLHNHLLLLDFHHYHVDLLDHDRVLEIYVFKLYKCNQSYNYLGHDHVLLLYRINVKFKQK